MFLSYGRTLCIAFLFIVYHWYDSHIPSRSREIESTLKLAMYIYNRVPYRRHIGETNIEIEPLRAWLPGEHAEEIESVMYKIKPKEK